MFFRGLGNNTLLALEPGMHLGKGWLRNGAYDSGMSSLRTQRRHYLYTPKFHLRRSVSEK
jgi:hypothetical protein